MRGRFYIADSAPSDAEVYGNLKFSRFMLGDKLACKAWRGKQGKPYAYYTFKSVEQRDAWITREKDAEDRHNQFRREREVAKEKQLQEMLQQIQVGTILTGSWGYDQTNAEIWEVTEKRGHAVWIRPVACETVPGSEGFMSSMVRPIPGKFCGDAVRRLITHNGIKLNECCTITPDDPKRAHYSSSYA